MGKERLFIYQVIYRYVCTGRNYQLNYRGNVALKGTLPMNKAAITFLVWFLPVIFLLLSLIPIAWPALIMPLLLQIVVSVASAFIVYFLFTQKPPYYMIWAIVFILFVMIYNPIITVSAFSSILLPLQLITAIIFIANWWFVFRGNYKLF